MDSDLSNAVAASQANHPSASRRDARKFYTSAERAMGGALPSTKFFEKIADPEGQALNLIHLTKRQWEEMGKPDRIYITIQAAP